MAREYREQFLGEQFRHFQAGGGEGQREDRQVELALREQLQNFRGGALGREITQDFGEVVRRHGGDRGEVQTPGVGLVARLPLASSNKIKICLVRSRNSSPARVS